MILYKINQKNIYSIALDRIMCFCIISKGREKIVQRCVVREFKYDTKEQATIFKRVFCCS